MARLATGEPVRGDALVHVLHDETGVPRQLERNTAAVHLPEERAVEAIDPNNPAILHHRYLLAAELAVAELVSEGVVVQVDAGGCTVEIRTPRSGFGVHVPAGRPALRESYQLARRHRGDVLAILDRDLFTAGLETLDVDPRMRLCMAEALEAYRRGLWLSCVNLLGAVSEGAWYRAAERLRNVSPQIDRALTDDVSAARIIRVVADELARARGLAGVAAMGRGLEVTCRLGGPRPSAAGNQNHAIR
ncbi:MAG: hypothetical protein ACRD0C_01335 [Acidimicrobiia bacterium]